MPATATTRPVPAGAGPPRLAVRGRGQGQHQRARRRRRPGDQALRRPRPARPSPPTRAPPATLRQLALAHADQIQPVTWRQGTKTTKDNPDAAMTSYFLAIRVRPASRHIPRARRRQPAGTAGCWPNGPPKPMSPPITGCPPCPTTPPSPSSSGWPRSAGGSSTTTASSRPAWAWTTSRAARSPAGTATSPSPSSPRPSHHDPHRPKSGCAGMTLYQVLVRHEALL